MNILLAGGSAATRSLTRRAGLVRAQGKAVQDDAGLFHPLGLTFFWALYGQKFERDRLRRHLQWLAPYGFDYLRILGDVDWPGEEIDSMWPDYEEILGGFIDDAYAIAGLRTELCLLGGAERDYIALCEKVERVILADRQHKVIALECANEAFDTGVAPQVLVKMAKHLRARLPHLIALSSPGNVAELVRDAQACGATMFTVHIDRNGGDNGWRSVRQGWDFKDLPFVVNSDEPVGPHSSIRSEENPLLLAMMRATGVLAGGAFYTLHVADMVFGRPQPERNRVANVWDVPNIDAYLKSVRKIDALLPAGIENWPKFNNAWPGHPLTTDAFWGGTNLDHGVNRNYCAAAGPNFVIVMNGVKNRCVSVARRAAHVDAYDPLTLRLVESADLSGGQQWPLPGRPDSLTGYIVVGRFL